MNPIFVLLVILCGVILWFSISSLFPLIGKVILDIIEEIKFNIIIDDEEEKD